MELTRWTRAALAGARSGSLATQTEIQEQTKRKGIRIMNGILMLTIVGLLIAPLAKAQAAGDAKPAAGLTAESVLAAEDEYIRAMRENDADGIARCLTDDWAVISAKGGLGEGKLIFPDGVKQGYLTRTAYEFSEPRVRLYGNVALVTVKVHTAGTFVGKPFDVMERETDVWLWKDGSWKCALTHETELGKPKQQTAN
jgi:ketosteroid isomerase-like protein